MCVLCDYRTFRVRYFIDMKYIFMVAINNDSINFSCVVIYLILPETEGRTLEEIEAYFSDKSRKFNDIQIRTVYDRQQSANKSFNRI